MSTGCRLAVMRDIRVERDREWLVLVVTRFRREKEPRISRMYLSTDEAALVIALLSREVPPVTSVP